MGTTASQITSLTIVYSTVYSDADQRKHQRSTSLGFVRGIHRGPVNPPHKWPVTRKMFPFDDVIIWSNRAVCVLLCFDGIKYLHYRPKVMAVFNKIHTSVTHRNTIFAVMNKTTGTLQFVDSNIVRVILTRYITKPKLGKGFLCESSLCLAVDLT